MTLVRERWTLMIEFDSTDVQRDRKLDYGDDDATRFVTWLRKNWGIQEPEEFEKCVQWTTERVEVTADLIDQLVEVTQYVMMHTIPRRVEIVRTDCT